MRVDILPLLGSWLLTYLLHSTLLLGVAWLATRRVVRAPGIRDLLWKAALVGGTVTASLQTGLGFEPMGGAVVLDFDRSAARRPGGSAGGGAVATATAGAEGGDHRSGVLFAPEPVPAQPRASAVGPASGVASASASPPPSIVHSDAAPANPRAGGPESRVLPVIVTLWVLGALALTGLYLVQRLRAMRRIGPRRQVSDVGLLDMLDGLRRAGGIRRQIRLTAAEGLSSPVALGHDEIALPEAALTDLDREQQRSMLAHELAHLERRDPSWLTLGCVIERVFFMQPLNRMARVRMQEAAEYLCDDWAVHRTGSGVSLATCLVKVAEWVDTPRPIPLVGMAEHRSQLVSRIHRLIEGRAMPVTRRSFWFLAGAVSLVGITAVAAPGFTTGEAWLSAQAPVQDTAARAAAADSVSRDTWYRRLNRQVRLARSRASLDMSRARLAERRALLEARAEGPHGLLPPIAPVPALAPRMAMDLERALAHAPGRGVSSDGKDRSRQRDTSSIAVPALIAALKDQDVEVRRAAAQSLANLEDVRAVPALIEATKDSDAEVRASAAQGLGQLGDKRATAALIAALKDPAKDVKHAALDALHEMPGDVPDDAILAALGDSDADIRESAMSLAESRLSSEDEDDNGNRRPADPRYVSAFTRLLGDPNADVRGHAASTLGEAGLKEAPAALLAAARDKSPDVRQNVASALGRIRDAKSVGTLKEMLQDTNSDVREQAVQALSEIRDRTALEALVTALKSADPVVRRQAAEALGQREEEK